jgi:hypothetical protein
MAVNRSDRLTLPPGPGPLRSKPPGDRGQGPPLQPLPPQQARKALRPPPRRNRQQYGRGFNAGEKRGACSGAALSVLAKSERTRMTRRSFDSASVLSAASGFGETVLVGSRPKAEARRVRSLGSEGPNPVTQAWRRQRLVLSAMGAGVDASLRSSSRTCRRPRLGLPPRQWSP